MGGRVVFCASRGGGDVVVEYAALIDVSAVFDVVVVPPKYFAIGRLVVVVVVLVVVIGLFVEVLLVDAIVELGENPPSSGRAHAANERKQNVMC